MTTSGAEPRGLGRILNSPITGFTPYIIISLFSSPNSFDVAIGCAVASALLIIAGNWMVNRIPAGQLDWAALILFGGMLIAGLIDNGAHSWLMENANLMADGAVLVMTIGGILVGRPFALMYARLSPKFEDAWQKDTPGFRDWGVRACRNISLFWFAAFIVQLGCQLLTQFGSSSYDNAIWNWIVPIAALLLAMRETHRYSAKLRAEAVKFEPAPS